jgi:hypothetical protein
LDLLALPEQAAPAVKQRYEHVLVEYTEKVTKYEQEKAKIQQKAKALEEERDQAQRHSKTFGLVVFLANCHFTQLDCGPL